MGFTSTRQVDEMTLADYDLLVEAMKLKNVDQDYRVHQQAFLNHAVRASKGKKQTPRYKKFKQFFDYEKAVKRIKEKKKTGLLSRVMDAMKEKGDDTDD